MLYSISQRGLHSPQTVPEAVLALRVLTPVFFLLVLEYGTTEKAFWFCFLGWVCWVFLVYFKKDPLSQVMLKVLTLGEGSDSVAF